MMLQLSGLLIVAGLSLLRHSPDSCPSVVDAYVSNPGSFTSLRTP